MRFENRCKSYNILLSTIPWEENRDKSIIPQLKQERNFHMEKTHKVPENMNTFKKLNNLKYDKQIKRHIIIKKCRT